MKHAGLIRRVAKEVAFATNARYGFTIVSPEDLVQDVHLKLIESGTDLDTKNNAEAWVRTTAKFQALHGIQRALWISGGTGTSKLLVADPSEIDELPHTERPEDTLVWKETLYEVEQAILSILAKVEAQEQREALEAHFLRGESHNDSASKQRRRRGLLCLTPEEGASLQAWRNFSHDAPRAVKLKAEATALLDVVRS